MSRNSKFWALFFLLIFGSYMLRGVIPPPETAPVIVWAGEEDSGEHHDEHDFDDDFQGLPIEDHHDELPLDYLAESNRTNSSKQVEKDKSDFFIAKAAVLPVVELTPGKLVPFEGWVLHDPFDWLTSPLRGPPHFV